MKPPTRIHQIFEVDEIEMKSPKRQYQIFELDEIEMKPSTSKFEVAVRVRGIDRNGQPYNGTIFPGTPVEIILVRS